MGIRVLHICLDDDHDVHVVAACLGLGIYMYIIYIYMYYWRGAYHSDYLKPNHPF